MIQARYREDLAALMSQPSKSRLSLSIAWVIALQVVLLVGAVCIHLFSALPLAYNWSGALRMFLEAVRDEYFLVMVAVALAAAAGVRRRGSPDSPLFRFDRRDLLSLAVVAVLLMALIVSSSLFGIWDYVFALPVVALAVPTLRQRHPIKALAGFGATVLVLLIVSYIFTILKSQLFVGRAPLDRLLVDAETWMFGRPLYLTIAEWASAHLAWVRFSGWVYYLFFHHMALTAIFLFACDDNEEQWRYVLSLALCYTLGGLSYFLLPAAGPVYFDPAAFAYLREGADLTAHLQEALKINTYRAASGQLQVVHPFAFIAAMPSLHMAHETVMLFYSRRSPLMLAFAACFWVGAFAAVLLLGWHYLADVAGGMLLAGLVIWLARKVRLTRDRGEARQSG